MYEWRPRLRGKTPAASTGGASRRSSSASSGRIAKRQLQRVRVGVVLGLARPRRRARRRPASRRRRARRGRHAGRRAAGWTSERAARRRAPRGESRRSPDRERATRKTAASQSDMARWYEPPGHALPGGTPGSLERTLGVRDARDLVPTLCRSCAGLQALDHAGDRLAEADAHARDPVALAAPLELAQERRRHAGTGRAERMPERDPAAVRVDVVPAVLEPGVARELERRRRRTPRSPRSRRCRPSSSPAFASAFAQASRVAVQHPVRVDAREPERDEAAARLAARAARMPGSLTISTAAAPSQIWLELPAVTTPLRDERGRQTRPALPADVSRRGVSSTPTSVPTCGIRHLDRHELALEAALVDRRDRPPVRLERVARRAPRARSPIPRRSPRRRSPAARSPSARAACPRGRRRSSPSGRATSSRRPPRRPRRAAPTTRRRPR